MKDSLNVGPIYQKYRTPVSPFYGDIATIRSMLASESMSRVGRGTRNIRIG